MLTLAVMFLYMAGIRSPSYKPAESAFETHTMLAGMTSRPAILVQI